MQSLFLEDVRGSQTQHKGTISPKTLFFLHDSFHKRIWNIYSLLMEVVKHKKFPGPKAVAHKEVCPRPWQTRQKTLNIMFGQLSSQMHM